MSKLQISSFFAGVGGIDLAFHLHDVETIYANEIDKYAIKTYEENFHQPIVDKRDICTVPSVEIPDSDIIVGGFPCQAFSIIGKREGFKDSKNRGRLIFELFRIIHDKQPKVIFLENVKGLIHHNYGQTFNIIINELYKLKYYVKWKVLNPTEYGNIPQNRHRVYIVAFKYKKNFKRFEFPEKIKLTHHINEYVDFKNLVNPNFYYTENMKRYVFYMSNIKDTESIFEYRFGRLKNCGKICNCLTTKSKTFIIKTFDGQLRTLTPREYFNLQGFPKMFKLPKETSNTQLYKQAGNSVCIPVVSRIAKNIIQSII